MNDPDEIAFEILRSLRRVLRRVSDHSRRLSAEVGLTVPQLLCLKAIGESDDPEMTLNALCKAVQLSPPTVSGVVDRLERAGLVVRERRARDRRKVCLSLTDAGRERLADLPKPLQVRFVERIEAMPPDERQALLDALRQVVEMMEASELDVAPMLMPGGEVKRG